MTFDLDGMPTPEVCIACTFSRTSRIAQKYIATKIWAKYYQDLTDVFLDFKKTFSDLDQEFYAQRKLIKLHQANRFCAKLYTEFSKYVAC